MQTPLLALLGVLVLIQASPLAAQPPLIEKDRGIPLDLGDESAGEIVDLVVAESGLYYLVDVQRHTVWKVDREGNLIRGIGHEGSGPGDLLHPFSAAVLNDRIYVLDTGNQRISVFSTEGGHLLSFRVDGPRTGGIASNGGDLVAVKGLWDATLFTVYDADGNETGKRGVQAPDYWGLHLGSRYISTTPDGQILTSDPTRYHVLRMDWDGQILVEYTADSPGFSGFDRSGSGIEESRRGTIVNMRDVLKAWTPMSRPLAVGGHVLAQWMKVGAIGETRSASKHYGDLFTMDGEPVRLAIELPLQFYAADGELLYGIDTAPVDGGEDNPHIVVYRLLKDNDQ